MSAVERLAIINDAELGLDFNAEISFFYEYKKYFFIKHIIIHASFAWFEGFHMKSFKENEFSSYK